MSLLQSVGYQKHNIGGAEDMPLPERFYVMQFIDTHIHLQDFKADCAPRVWHNPEAKGLVLVSAGREDFAKIAALLRQYPGKASGAFGIIGKRRRWTNSKPVCGNFRRRLSEKSAWTS